MKLISNEKLDAKNQFLTILEKKTIKMVFQPIISLTSGNIHGFEGLTRGPINSPFHSPLKLFSYAERLGYLYTLEKMARELAIKLNPIQDKEKLFININSQVIYDPKFTPGHTISILEKYNLSPSDVVFEITERNAIQDFSAFREVLKHYRDQGFQIAIDDAGAGYSSLQAISELMPDYIKIDRSLVSDVHLSDVKLHILEAFVTFSKKMKSIIIAEGIETKEELCRVVDLGIDCGQGYIFGYPSYPVEEINNKIIYELNNQEHNKGQKAIYVQLEDQLIIMDGDQVIRKEDVRSLLSSKM